MLALMFVDWLNDRLRSPASLVLSVLLSFNVDVFDVFFFHLSIIITDYIENYYEKVSSSDMP